MKNPSPADSDPLDFLGLESDEPLSQPSEGDKLQDNIEMIMRIPVSVKIVLGSVTMPVARLVKLGRGAVVPLDRRVGEPVDVVVNGHVIARGVVVVVAADGSRFGVSLTEILARGTRK